MGRLGLGATTAFAGLTGTAVDGAIVDGNIKRTKGWGVTAALLHYWTPSVRQAVFGNYTAVDYSGRVSTAYDALDDFKIWTVGTNVIWSPVSAFDIGVEVLYQKLDPKGRVVLPTGVSKSSVDIWEARIRFQRDF
ncbi:MAG: porin [Pseudomonadota bacterium]